MAKEKESIEGVFGNITTALYHIRASSSGNLQRYYISNINLQLITTKIFKLEPHEALNALSLTLTDIAEIQHTNAHTVFIEPTGDSADVREYAYDDEGRAFFDDEGNQRRKPSPRDIYNQEVIAKEANQKALSKIEAELLTLKDKLIDRINSLETSPKSKLKLELSVEEIATLFRGLEKAGVIFLDKNPPLSAFIAQNFSSKKEAVISSKSFSNKMSENKEATINSVLAMLDNVDISLKLTTLFYWRLTTPNRLGFSGSFSG
jgi:hypothetical protein